MAASTKSRKPGDENKLQITGHGFEASATGRFAIVSLLLVVGAIMFLFAIRIL